MKKIFYISFSLILCLLTTTVQSQDVRFSQSLVNRAYLNPSFTGIIDEARAGLTNRVQWASVPGAFSSQYFFADYNVLGKHGVGIAVLRDQSGGGLLNTNAFGVKYSYSLDLSTDWKVRAGCSIDVGQKRLDVDQFLYDDASFSAIENPNPSYATIGLGGVLYNENLWVGVGGSNLNSPSFSMTNSSVSTIMYPKYNLAIGSRLLLKQAYSDAQNSFFLFPSFNYVKQGDFQSLEVLLQTEVSNIIIGTQYRMVSQSEAITGMLGISIEGLKFVYSYDYTLTNLSQYSSGGHEVSLAYDFRIMKKWSSKKKSLPWI